jgi:ATP-binding cassette subfamily F protein 3
MKMLERLQAIEPVRARREWRFEFPQPVRVPERLIDSEAMALGYGDCDVLAGVTVSVRAGDRIGVLGVNGAGKSTLIKAIAGELSPRAGELRRGQGLAIGYFAQHQLDQLRPDESPLQHLRRLAALTEPQAREQELRNFLGQFRFEGDMVQQRVGTLSGGERARLVLATIVWQRPNLLLLDEPTNHLDLNTREALSIALNEFEGTVLLVSHDRALLREVCDEFWLVTRGGVEPFDGDLDDYQRWLLEVARAVARGAEPPRPGAAPASAPSAPPVPTQRAAAPTPAAPTAPAPVRRDDRKAAAQARAEKAQRTRPLRNELKSIDERLARLASERAEIENALAGGRVSGAEMADTGRRLNHIGAEVAMLEERWLELGAELEAIESGA